MGDDAVTVGQKIDEFVRRLSGRRTPPLVAGVVLLAVPTLFTVMPQFASDWKTPVKALILGGWFLVAVVSVGAGGRRDSRIDRMATEHDRDQRRYRVNALYDVMEALLRPGTKDMPNHYEFTVYIWDEEANRLNAWFPHWDDGIGEDVRWFAPGCGATGNAWQQQRTFVVRGVAVANDKYDLREEQRSFWHDYRSVASTPIWNEAEGQSPMGVVTAISKVDDAYFEVGAGAGQAALRELAETIGVVLRRIPYPDDLKGG